MVVVRMRAVLRLYDSRSLKAKRQVVQSVKERLRRRFNVAVAEVGSLDEHRTAELGIVTVAVDAAGADTTVDAVTGFLDADVRFEMVERELERH